MREIIYKMLLGGGLEKFSAIDELKWYLLKGYKRLANPKVWGNLISQHREFKLRKTYLRSRPYIVQIEETNKCNLNCPMCYRRLQNRKYGEMSFENAKKIIDQFPYLLWISWGGWGEPLMCKDLFKMIDYCNNKGIGAGFITNGTLLTSNNIDKIVGAKFLRLGISIDSATPEKIRNYKNFEKMKENIKTLTELIELRGKFLPLRFVVTLMRKNLHDLKGIILLAKEVGIKHVHIHGVDVYDEQLRGSIYDLPSEKEIKSMLQEVLSLGRVQNIRVTYTGLFRRSAKVPLCKFPWTTCFIAWDGAVHPCCMYLEKSFGNVFETSFEDIWNSEDYQEFRKNMAEGNPDEICKVRCGGDQTYGK